MDSTVGYLVITGLGIIANWFAWSYGLYKAPGVCQPSSVRVRASAVFGTFAIYLFCSTFLSKLAFRLFRGYMYTHFVSVVNGIQFVTVTLNIVLLFFFSRAFIDRSSLRKIWKDRSFSYAKSIGYDVLLGLFFWLTSLPFIIIVTGLCDFFIYHLAGVREYEQVAVQYLKMSIASPPLLFMALSLILVIAPWLEEFLFRGILQSSLRHYFGAKAAVLLSSLGFALFHLAPSQGWGNLTLVATLFTFACFLGFVYERQRSLFASIALHSAFNAVSTIRILLEVWA